MEQWAMLFRGGRAMSLVALALGIWLHAADSLLVATVMPSAVRELGGAEWLAWALTLYLLGSIAAGAVTGALVARLGLTACMVGGALVYVVGCVVSAVAGDMGVLLLGRAGQGFGGGGMVAVAHVAVCRLFPAAQWPRLFALLSAVWGASALCGPLVGGLFAEAGYWRGAFWAFAVQALLLAGLALVALRGGEDAREEGARLSPAPFLVLMAAVAAVGLAGNVPGVLPAVLLMAGGLALVGLFLAMDARAAAPVLPRAAGAGVGAGLLMVLLLSVSTMAFAVYGPLLMERLHGAGPLLGGYMVASESAAWTVAALLFAGVGSARGEARLIRAGALLTVAGTALFAVFVPLGPLWLLLPGALAQGAGMGMAWGFIARRVVEAGSAADRARAASAVPTTQQFGYALGAALAGVVANAAGFAEGVSVGAGISVGFWVFYAFLPPGLVGVAAAWRLAAAPATNLYAAEKQAIRRAPSICSEDGG